MALLGLVCLSGVPAAADGFGSDTDLHVAQTLGRRELTVVIRRVGPVLGPLRVDIVTHAGDAPGSLRITATSPGVGASSAMLEVGPPPGFYSTTLNVDRAGPWELLVDDGDTETRIPFLVPAQVIPPWKKASDYGFFTAGALLVVALGVTVCARRSWVALVPATGTVIALTVAVTGAVLSAYSPPPPQAGRDVDPTVDSIRDPYRRIAANSLAAPDYSRPPANLTVSRTPTASGSLLQLNVIDSATGRPADDLLVHHSALIHLIMVSPSGAMSHLHPVRVAPRHYQVHLEHVESGTYAIAAEIARRGGGVQLLRTSIEVRTPELRSPPPSAVASPAHIVADLASAGSPSTIRAQFGDSADLQPWLGMTGHMIVIGPLPAEGEVGIAALRAPIWAHAHAMPPPTPGSVGGQPDESVARYGPGIEFTYTFALPGRYRLWVQAERDYAILTAPTEVEVAQS